MRRIGIATSCALAAVLGTPGLPGVGTARAGNLFWDGGTIDITSNGNGVSAGTAGNWDNLLKNWDSGAVPHVAWNSSNNDTALFAGTAGIVTLTDNVTVGGLQFNTTGYTLTGTTNSKTLTFGAADNLILFSGIAAATISGTVAGNNLSIATNTPTTAGTISFLGASTAGWTGTTTIGPGMTLSLDGAAGNTSGALRSTTSITLNGGASILANGVVSANIGVDYINNTAPITVNAGGSITWRPVNTATGSETIGAVTVNSGQVTFQTGTQSSGTDTLIINTGGITRTESTSVLNFSTGSGGPLSGATNLIKVTGAGTTAGWTSGASSNSIIGPWAFTGTATASDYLAYSSDSVVPANTAASAETTWTNATKQYTLAIPTVTTAGASTALTATRNVLALKASSTATNLTSATVSGSPTFTLTGHTLSVGDPVVLGGTAPTGFSTGTVYYVASVVAGTSFTLAATPDGAAINATSVQTPNVTTGLKLDSGKNLGTSGILNGSTAPIGIGRTAAGGQVTLPTAGAGNLFVTPTVGTISIDASIVDNGGALTLVKSGNGNLFLSGTNTYSGNTVLNAGTLGTTSDSQLGTGGVVVNGPATWNLDRGGAFAVTYNRPITINDYATLTLASGNAGKTLTGALTGNGIYVNGSTTTMFFNSTANTFTGTVNSGYESQFASLGDSTNPINLGSSTNGFNWIGGTKTFALRPFTLSATGANILANNGTGPLTIQQNLAFSGAAGARTFTLGGAYANNPNTFAGNIADGPGSVVTVTKAGAGAWLISGNLSHTGGLNINGGNLTLTGTNTYSGQTTFSTSFSNLVFAGSQAVSPNTNFLTNSGASTNSSQITLLDDTGGVNNSIITLPNTFTIQDNNTPGNNHTFFVGNNNTLNGGTSSGTTTGSTIAIANLNWGTEASGTANVGKIPVQGANGYRLQINNVTLHNAANNTAGTNTFTTFTPTTANLTLGTVTMATGNNGLGVPFLVLDGTSSDNRVTGIISNATDALTTGRPLNVTKSSLGNWTLSGANSYTGATAVTGGRLLLSSTGSIASGSAVTVSGGSLGGTGTVNGVVTVSGTGGINLTDGAVGTLSLGSTLSVTGAANANNFVFDLASAGSTVDKIAVTGVFSMTTSGAGVVNLNQLGGSANRLTGGTYDLLTAASGINASDFRLAATKAFGQTFALSSPVDGTKLQLTAAQVTAAAGNVTLGGTSPSWTVAASFTPANLPDYQSNVTVNSAIGTSNLNASQDINSLTYGTGATTGTTIAAGTAAAGTPFNMLVIEAAGVNGNTAGNGITVSNTNAVTHTISANIGLASSQTWTVSNSTTGLTVSGVVSDFGGGSTLTKSGAGALTLSGANTYSGGTNINQGTLKVGNATGLGDSAGAVSVASGAVLDLNGQAMTSVNALTLNGTGISNGGALINSNATAATYAGLLTLAGNTGITSTTGAITLSNPGTITGSGFNLTIGGNSSITIASALALGSGAITKNGNGTLSLGGNNTLTTGGITVNGGTLTASANVTNVFGAPSGTLTFNAGTLSLNSNIVFNPISVAASAAVAISSGNSFGSTLGGPITLGAGSTTTFTNQNGNTITINGVISGAGNLTKNNITGNQGTTILTAANTFTGNTVIAGNTTTSGVALLTLSNALALQNSILDTTTSVAGTSFCGLRTTVTTLTLGGLSGNKDLSSLFTTNTTTTGGYTGVTALTLNPNASQAPSYSGVIGNGAANMTLAKTGSGSQVLSAPNTYTGGTTITGGTLAVNTAVAGTDSGTGTGNVSVTGATLAGSGQIAPGSTNAVTVGAGGVVAPGSTGIGVLTFNSASTSAASLLAFTGDGSILAELGAGLTADKVSITSAGLGDVSFNNTVVNFTDLTSGSLSTGTYTLLSADAAGAYQGLTTDISGNITAGLTIGTGLTAYPGSTLAVSGNDIVLNVVPEPGTLGLAALAGAGLLARRRGRR